MAIKLTKELLTIQAQNDVKESSSGGSLTSSQVRKFYEDFLILQEKSNWIPENEFQEKVLPLVLFSKAKLAYAYGRDGSKIPRKFVDILSSYIDRIETKEDFNNFLYYYQAFIGYFKFQEKIDKADKQNKYTEKRHKVWN